MLWIIILLCIVCFFVCELTDNIVANIIKKSSPRFFSTLYR